VANLIQFSRKTRGRNHSRRIGNKNREGEWRRRTWEGRVRGSTGSFKAKLFAFRAIEDGFL
jgi:hypothetical protein